MKYKNLELNTYNKIKIDSIKNLYIGSVALLANTPICIYNINSDTIPAVIISVFEVGIIYISVKNIKKIINVSKNIKNNKKRHTIESNNLIDSYLAIEKDLDKKIELSSKDNKRKELIKLKNNLTKLYN